MTEQSALFDVNAIDPGVYVRLASQRYPRRCSQHPASVSSHCLYGVCDRSAEITRRRRAGECPGERITAFQAGDLVRDIFFLDEELVVRAYLSDRRPAILRTVKAGPGRGGLSRGDRTMCDANGPRWERVE